eukprot:Gb_01603 [translate_table: standard]
MPLLAKPSSAHLRILSKLHTLGFDHTTPPCERHCNATYRNNTPPGVNSMQVHGFILTAFVTPTCNVDTCRFGQLIPRSPVPTVSRLPGAGRACPQRQQDRLTECKGLISLWTFVFPNPATWIFLKLGFGNLSVFTIRTRKPTRNNSEPKQTHDELLLILSVCSSVSNGSHAFGSRMHGHFVQLEMGTGWRRARNALGLTVCTSIPRDLDALDSASPRTQAENVSSPRLLPENISSPRLQQLENIVVANPRLQCQTVSSPRLRCQTGVSPRVQSSLSQVSVSSPRAYSQSQCSPRLQSLSPRLQCRTSGSPRLRNIENVPLTEGSVPSSPRSPARLSLLKSSMRLSRSTCAMCLQTMKPGQGHAIFTAECSHAFHFPCIASNVKHGNLICPVCRAKWKEVPSQASISVVHKEEIPERVSILTPRSSRGVNYSSSRRQEEISDHEHRRLERIPNESITPRGSHQIPSSEPLYDDDEPLDATLRSNGRIFSTIHEDEEEFEFKGFVVQSEGGMNEAVEKPVNPKNGLLIRNVEVTLHPEVGVVAAGKSYDKFAVLLHVKAPPGNDRQQKNVKQNSSSLLLDPNYRAPIDLVTVLDVSGSMSGTKLQLLKRAMRLVISSLSPADRLSVVVFSSTAKRVFPLRRMVPQGQRAARRVIDRLVCSEGTNIADGLKKAGKILEDRRERNPVASIMLLSDGQDKHSINTLQSRQSLPGSIRQSTRYGHIEIPVHAFGFGNDHDAAKMHTISEESGGTFSFIEAEDAFAQCIGGLLSVVVQDVQVTISCSSAPVVELRSIYAGNYQTRIFDDHGTVKLGDLYAEEDRDVIVEVKIPAVKFASPMKIMSVKCSFKDPVSQQIMYAKEQFLTIPRPESIRGYPTSVSLKVEKHKNKLRTAQAISEARTLADRGDMNGAQQILHNAKTLLQCSAVSRIGDQLRSALEAEMAEIQGRIAQQRNNAYERERLAESSRERRRSSTNCTTERQRSNNRRVEYEATPASMLDMVMRYQTDSNDEPLTPTSAWRAAERLAKVAMMRKSLNRVSDLHGFENARF